jgi:hypothetical protein
LHEGVVAALCVDKRTARVTHIIADDRHRRAAIRSIAKNVERDRTFHDLPQITPYLRSACALRKRGITHAATLREASKEISMKRTWILGSVVSVACWASIGSIGCTGDVGSSGASTATNGTTSETPSQTPVVASAPSKSTSTPATPDAGSSTTSDQPDANTTTTNTNGNDDASAPDTNDAATSMTEPGASNTGPTDPGALKASGSITITTDGAIVENVDVSGSITIQANNVTLRNFRVNASGSWAVQVMGGYTNALIEDGEVTGDADGLWLREVTLQRVEIHNMGQDGMKGLGDNVTIEGCWIHNLGMSSGAHADGIQIMNGSHYVIRGNNFDMPWYFVANGQRYLANSNFFLNAYPVGSATVSDILIDSNWLNGGNFSIYALGQSDTVVTNNVFGADSQYGLLDGKAATWSGNTMAAGGAASP